MFLRRFLPSARRIRSEKSLRVFGAALHKPDLWHLNRRSVALATAVGLFNAWVPVPFQMVLSAGAAIMIGCNLPISVALVWISNPLTMPVLYYGSYKLGTVLLGEPVRDVEFAVSFDWLAAELGAIWEPFLLGCFVIGVASALFGYVGVQVLWRITVSKRWQNRVLRRKRK